MLVLLTCSMIAFTAAPVNPDNQAAVSQKLAVGVIEMPPFVMKAQNGPWQGISMNLLEAIAKELNLTLEIREYDSGNKLKEALLAEEIHLVPAVGMSENLEKIINFSNPYRLSGLAIAIHSPDSCGLHFSSPISSQHTGRFNRWIGSFPNRTSAGGSGSWPS